jgi:type IV pilus assembly protein PilW
MKPASRPAAAAARGLTIVELLIAVSIGLLITIVIAQLFLNTRQTFATTDDMSRMQENVRFAQQLLIRTIHLAGYRSQPNSVAATVFGATPALGYTAGATVTAPDTLTLRFQGSGNGAGTADSSVLDCLGVAIDAGVMATNTFSIANGLNGNPALFCNNGVNNLEIVPDVENFQLLFGEDTNADLTADRYVAVPDNIANVVSVRISLLFSTPNNIKAAVDGRTYDMFSDGSSVHGPYGDRRVRRVVMTTVNLRNRTP